jgi:hypothetical protein
VIVYGIRKYGRCDDLGAEAGGDIHVATKFFHIWFIPLVPTSSFLVLGEEGDGFRGISIPMSGKSVFAAYFRTGMVVLAITGIALFPVGLILTAIAIGAFIGSYKMFGPSAERRAQLMSMITAPAQPRQMPVAPPVVREPPPAGPNLVLMPQYDFNALKALVERSGGQPVAPPPNAYTRWWTGTTAITLFAQAGSPTVLVFEGADAEPWKQTVASTLGYVAASDVHRMRHSQNPAEAQWAHAAGAVLRV